MSDERQPMISIELLYTAMSKEASGLYSQMIAICTAFLGGTLLFFDKLYIAGVCWTLYLLFIGWAALTYPLAIMIYIRWKNIESHRHVLEYFKTQEENQYDKAKSLALAGRKWTRSAIISMVGGLVLIAVFVGINIIYKKVGG